MEFWNIKKNHMLVSRAATGIYVILAANGLKGCNVLVPANICYAAIYPIIYSGNIPVFCDVDANTGNVSFSTFQHFGGKISAAIIPHMYGNPVLEISEIAKYCCKNRILLIEDCASAMGAYSNGIMCGTYGDYAIYSTGYSKTIDVGGGGIVFSDNSLENLENLYEKLPPRTVTEQMNEEFFSKLYRLIRNSSGQSLAETIWKAIQRPVQNVFIHHTREYDAQIVSQIERLEEVIALRRRKQELYMQNVRENDDCHIYRYLEGAVPWRFSMMVNPKMHRDIIDFLLQNNVPVSDWYPVSTSIFGDRGVYIGAEKMESMILNFPLLLENEKIIYVCEQINNYFEKQSEIL